MSMPAIERVIPLVSQLPAAIREALVRGMSFDALFVTGGMSMGEYDYVPMV